MRVSQIWSCFQAKSCIFSLLPLFDRILANFGRLGFVFIFEGVRIEKNLRQIVNGSNWFSLFLVPSDLNLIGSLFWQMSEKCDFFGDLFDHKGMVHDSVN